MKLCLASIESKEAFEAVMTHGVPNLLMSYEYMRKMGAARLHDQLQSVRDQKRWIICDSGAFTWKSRCSFMSIKKQKDTVERKAALIENWGEDVTEEELLARMEAFNDQYLEFLGEYSQYFDAVAELDLGMFIGTRIWEWRAKIKEVMNDEVGRIICTPHYLNKPEHIHRLVVEEGFTFLGISLQPRMTSAFFTTHMDLFQEHKVRVHGWAKTDVASLQKFPYYSVDSSRWKGGLRWGSTYLYQGNGKIITIDFKQKEVRKKYESLCEELGINFQNFIDEKVPEQYAFSAYQWRLLAEDVERDTRLAYWLTEEEKEAMIEEDREKYEVATARPRSPAIVTPDQDERLMVGRFCSTCAVATKCPRYEEKAECAFTKVVTIQTTKDFRAMVMNLVGVQYDRVMHGRMFERLQGGYLDKNLSYEIKQLMDMLEQTKSIAGVQEGVTIQAEGAGAVSQLLAEVFSKRGAPRSRKKRKKKSPVIIEAKSLKPVGSSN